MLRLFDLNWDNSMKEVHKSGSVATIHELEVYALIFLLDVRDMVMGTLFEDELLEVEKCSLVFRALANLDD